MNQANAPLLVKSFPKIPRTHNLKHPSLAETHSYKTNFIDSLKCALQIHFLKFLKCLFGSANALAQECFLKLKELAMCFQKFQIRKKPETRGYTLWIIKCNP